MLNPFKKSHQYNVAKNSFVIRINLLDGTSTEFNLQPIVTGNDCLEKVAQTLDMDLQEVRFFGLQYQSKYDCPRWVDRNTGLKKQLEKYALGGARNAELSFRVQFYVTSVSKLQDEMTLYLYFLQLKHLVLGGMLPCVGDVAVKIASYALQAELGDYENDEQVQSYIDEYQILPPSISSSGTIKNLIDRTVKLYQRHSGMSASASELMYIRIVQQLPDYGHESYDALDGVGAPLKIGACFIGIFVKHSNGQPTIFFKWPDVYSMKAKDKNFGIETATETVMFRMRDRPSAKYLLRMMIEQHCFYHPPPPKSKKPHGLGGRSTSLSHSIDQTGTKHITDPYSRGFSRTSLGNASIISTPRREILLTTDSPYPRSHYRLPSTAESAHSKSPPPNTNTDLISPKDITIDVEIEAEAQPQIRQSPERGSSRRLKLSNGHATAANGHIDGPTEQLDDNEEVTNKDTSVVRRESNKILADNKEETKGGSAVVRRESSKKLTDKIPLISVIRRDSSKTSRDMKKLPITTEKYHQVMADLGPKPAIIDDSVNDNNSSPKMSKYKPRDLHSSSDTVRTGQSNMEIDTTKSSLASLGNGAAVKPRQASTTSNDLPPVFSPSIVTTDGPSVSGVAPRETVSTVSSSVSDINDLEKYLDDSDDDDDLDQVVELTAAKPVVTKKSRKKSSSSSSKKSPKSRQFSSGMDNGGLSPPPAAEPIKGELLEQKINSNEVFEEYGHIAKRKIGATYSSSKLSDNVIKNRYKDILPYEDTRVRLNPNNNLTGNDYINANHVNYTVGGVTKKFIVAQGPLPHTSTDFWQMIWENDVHVVVMTSNIMENGHAKCHQYFPADDRPSDGPNHVQFDQYRVTSQFVVSGCVTTRGLVVKHIPSSKEREVIQLHYTEWPDHGIPDDPQPFIGFVNELRSLRKRFDSSSPIVVHCSAGVGRSGVVALTEMLIDKIDIGEFIDIPNCLKELRQQRMVLVQTPMQYKFVYMALLRYIQSSRLI
ncbi:tyrosine-protein phosphatase non-receptor type 21-like [Dysidea avara]|uniref:tyrosine-protein phosphatase non-receptor type 21-like n=1 Tax=Dysidea avara TaxID=196820 RepID=UPI00331B9E71